MTFLQQSVLYYLVDEGLPLSFAETEVLNLLVFERVDLRSWYGDGGPGAVLRHLAQLELLALRAVARVARLARVRPVGGQLEPGRLRQPHAEDLERDVLVLEGLHVAALVRVANLAGDGGEADGDDVGGGGGRSGRGLSGAVTAIHGLPGLTAAQEAVGGVSAVVRVSQQRGKEGWKKLKEY